MTFCSPCAVGHGLATECEEVRISDRRRNSTSGQSVYSVHHSKTNASNRPSFPHNYPLASVFSTHTEIWKLGWNKHQGSFYSEFSFPWAMCKWAYFTPIYLYKICCHNRHWSKCFCLFQKKNHTCTPPKNSNSYFSLYVQTNKRDKKRNWRLFLMITGQNLTSEICMHTGLCTCRREALCYLESNYVSNECHRDLSQDLIWPLLYYGKVGLGS